MVTIRYNPTTAQIVGDLPQSLTDFLYDTLSYELAGTEQARGIFYASKGKLNKMFKYWDGKNRLYQKVKKIFPTGLMMQVATILKSHGVEYRVEPENPDTRGPRFQPGTELFLDSHIVQFDDGPKAVSLRTDQIQIVTELTKYKRATAQAPTGSGKTLITSELTQRYPELKILVLVPTIDLLYQTQEEVARFTGERVGLWGDSEYEDARIVVSSVQTACYDLPDKKALKKDDFEYFMGLPATQERVRRLEEFEYVIYDEAHLAGTDSHRILGYFLTNAWIRHGITATLWREDGAEMLLEGIIGPKVAEVQLQHLIDIGVLSDLEIIMCEYQHEGVKHKSWKETKDTVLQDIGRTQFLLARTQEVMRDKGVDRAISLYNFKEHGQQILAEMQSFCPNALLIDGRSNPKSRKLAVQKLKDGAINMLLGSRILDVGTNIPCAQLLSVFAAGKSVSMLAQRVGRVVRSFPGKKKAYVVDVYDLGNKHLEGQAKARLAAYCRFYGPQRIYILRLNGKLERLF